MPPAGHPSRADYFRWLFFAAGPVESAVLARALKWEVPEGRQTAAGFGSYADTLNTLEKALLPGPYLCGAQFTAADVYAGSQLVWGMMFGTIEKRPVFEAYVSRMQSRTAAQRANQINEGFLKARMSPSC